MHEHGNGAFHIELLGARCRVYLFIFVMNHKVNLFSISGMLIA